MASMGQIFGRFPPRRSRLGSDSEKDGTSQCSSSSVGSICEAPLLVSLYLNRPGILLSRVLPRKMDFLSSVCSLDCHTPRSLFCTMASMESLSYTNLQAFQGLAPPLYTPFSVQGLDWWRAPEFHCDMYSEPARRGRY